MEIDKPTPEIVAAIEGAVAWLESVAIPGLRSKTFTGRRRPGTGGSSRILSRRLLWARFYELGTNRPIFPGRD